MKQSFSQLGRQLLTIWQQLGLNQRISVVLATGVLLASLGGLSFWCWRVEYALLYGKLDQAEAGKVIPALDEAKVPYKVSGGGSSIYVPADKVYSVRMQLASRGIPRGEGIGFEIFDKPNFGISDFVQRANYLRAVQGELARTIAQVDTVEHARVLLVIPENRLLVDNQKRPTASVFVRVRGNSPLAPQTVSAIRFLVANAVEGLQPNQVSVVDNQGNVLSENGDVDSLAGVSSSQLAARKEMELYLAKKAEGMLERVLGPGQAVVRVAADINFESVTRTEEKYDPDGQVIRSSTINDENVELSTPNGGGGAPGAVANASTETNLVVAGSSPNNNRTRKKVTTQQYELNKVRSDHIQAAGGLKRISAAVFVAARTEGAGSDRKVVPRTKEELEKLRQIVQSALGIQEGPDSERRDVITLEEMPFNEDSALELAQGLKRDADRQLWWEMGKNALYGLLVLSIALAFWRIFQRTPVDDLPIGVPVGELMAEANGHSPVRMTSGSPTAEGTNGASLNSLSVDALNKMLRENPSNVTQAIRHWMVHTKER